MAQGYLTLDEAAQKLGMPADELKGMASKRAIRAFQDRGTWRFRVQDIEELSRQRGRGSDPELTLGETRPSMPVDAGPKTPAPKPAESEVFDFSLDTDDSVPIGVEPLGGATPSSKKKTDSKVGPRTPTPTPAPGSDSDVKLVPEGSDPILAADVPVKGPESPPPRRKTSGLKIQPGPESPPPRRKTSGLKLETAAEMPASPLPSKRRTGLPADDSPPIDSGVKLVPMDSDSDVRLEDSSPADVPLGSQPPRTGVDSDVRLEMRPDEPIRDEQAHITEEIDLGDIGLAFEDEIKTPGSGKADRPAVPNFPDTSPFELSEPDLQLPEESTPLEGTSDSSDFELTPAGDISSPADEGSSDDFTLELPDELESPGLTENAGLLDHGTDSGIALEQAADSSGEIEFELTLDEGSTPPPSSGKKGVDDSDSEFELTLDAEGTPAAPEGSDSEFELTLDDSGGLAPLDDSSDEKNIFETNLEVGELDEESGSMAVALDDADTGLDSSDFEVALGGDDIDVDVDEESGSEVMALDEDEDFGLSPEELEAGGGVRTVVKEKIVSNAPWGVLPVALMVPCVAIVFLVGFMGFELVQSQGTGYRPPGPLTRAVAKIMGHEMKN